MAFSRSSAVLTILLAGALLVATPSVALAKDCKPVVATGVGQDLGGGSTTATISGDPRLRGTTAGRFDVTGLPPVLQIAGTVAFTTHHGTLDVTVTGTFDVSTGAFSASGPVTGGSSRYAGPGGSLLLEGVENLSDGTFTETIEGTVCKR